MNVHSECWLNFIHVDPKVSKIQCSFILQSKDVKMSHESGVCVRRVIQGHRNLGLNDRGLTRVGESLTPRTMTLSALSLASRSERTIKLS